ncbi:putative type I restriction enzymeP M protein [Caloramator mitchellensis]|uniref:site-specific DNA-methyltransferase (adenine-specific) n=1 Tax=Caloramator mitchellensis TaxID=908809 RepID=A0A0R3K3H8_CALMK|nr:N-6 DNA methylase [Caloramator mitchellensis]KRQ87490.1 putative type I restriction enzymeP M protein [Caloramator mitchellensis]
MNQLQKHFNKREKVLGQYFTPIEVSQMIVERCLKYLNKDASEANAIDPACGDGSFLKALYDKGIRNFEGLDIDNNIYSLLTLDLINKVKIYDSLNLKVEMVYDLAVGNPPFSSKYNRISDESILRRFDLGRDRKTQAVEILFLEKFIKLLRYDGLIGIILPLGIAGASNLQYVRNYLKENIEIKEIIYLEPGLFKNGASTIAIIGMKKYNPQNSICKFGILRSLKPLFIDYVEKEIDFNNLNPIFYLNDFDKDEGIKLDELIDELFTGKGFYKDERKIMLSNEKTDSLYITAKNVGWGEFIRNRLLYFKGKLDNKYYLKKGDIVFCRVGQGTIGRCLVIDESLEGSIVDDWFHIIRLKNKSLSKKICDYFLSEEFKKKIKINCIGTGTPNISKQRLLNLKIPIHMFNDKAND